ncbi:MAG: patatin-like phospholipase family protein, partial [Leptospiraceae bacterium]|nr:patatin-like phospholipase family protein [Leptospiraceae bacterium]
MSKIKFFVVSISGGGIRGILPAKILNYIQNKLREKSQDDNFHLSSLVDLYAGTSTGSIIALALNLKEDEKFKFLPGDLIQLYLDYGKDIFKQDFIHNLFTLGGLTGPRYSELGLESVIEKFFKDKSLLDLHTNVIIPAHNITQDDPNKVLTFFTSHDAKKKDLNYFLKDVIRASTAAPTYFAPAYFKRINENKEYFGESTGYIDGGVFANCPALC